LHLHLVDSAADETRRFIRIPEFVRLVRHVERFACLVRIAMAAPRALVGRIDLLTLPKGAAADWCTRQVETLQSHVMFEHRDP
jgi:hypothetical protein